MDSILPNKFVCLMYHEIEILGAATYRSNPGYMRYVVKDSSLAQQLGAIRAIGSSASTVSEACRGSGSIAITVDDSTASDIDVFAPILLENGCRATFYAVASRIDTIHHLTKQDLRQLTKLGMEVGSHGLNHSYLPAMSTSEIHCELSRSKDLLEQATGTPVTHFSCPFGGFSPKLLDIAMNVGYVTVATSRIGSNIPGNIILNRIPIYRNTSLSTFTRLCQGGGLSRPLLRQTLLSPLKKLTKFRGYSKW